MKPLAEMPEAVRKSIRFVLTDIDDTLTDEGRLGAGAYGALQRLREAGLKVIPITGRPAGWCDHIARMWPVDGVVGENGAFYFRYDDSKKRMIRRFMKDEPQRTEDRRKLAKLRQRILAEVPGAGLSADQPYREADLAIDFCEDVPALDKTQVARIVELFEEAGAHAKVSSIHVNGWFGDWDKLSMTRLMLSEQFDTDLDAIRDSIVFSGDSPNDAPMFGFFPNSMGVANVLDFRGELDAEPGWISHSRGGAGFVELAELLLG
ncbi:HAD-IIB family hydrolase [Desulfovibrio ferrophilus]|uniref:HAD-superfamily hydrolase n=1 Tax=Desulfovibrio ferrophilus TaxID=241368 RepID=A0A2Z6AYF9_9BACT|nr:HAD-IIB family hydrolase [Desulfovibrio ferrophilus]BBD08205.1 HAD-superfamily hydrolase [Desulfovibrio ferrophilus]